MDIRTFLTALGFTPKNGVSGVYHKVYGSHGDYEISVDFNEDRIDYGGGITAESRTTQNFSQRENFVVLECVDRLLYKGYRPRNIVLEKTWPSGHGTSGRLDICVNRDDGTPYMLIECKTFGSEFDRELRNIYKNGGQLFTYFQLSGCKADILMLYASDFHDDTVDYRNEIVRIADEYRTGDVKDIYEKWNKLTVGTGIFDPEVRPYGFHSRALTKDDLKVIGIDDSKFIFKQFREILRHNVVSDNENAFNKMFNLFLCKVYDETTVRNGQELQFQWFEGRDNDEDFQLRLTDLYNKGMRKFLGRSVSDFDETDFESRCDNVYIPDDFKDYFLREVRKLRLEKNNEFAFKEVYDKASFKENATVVREVVELLQGYRIRYNRRHQYLSDFFELLLGSGVKQEAGQFFTPVPVAQFIIKSLPLSDIVSERLESEDGEILPYMIDYAAGSGHFITEYMHEIQSLLSICDKDQYMAETQKRIGFYKDTQFSWAPTYVYGIEKDYRLVKVSKVGCYLNGDGLANVILSDGLASFRGNPEYKGKLHKETDDGKKDNQRFDVLLSNPPYSVSSFRRTTRDYYTEKDFDLYKYLTDNSSEIECLFVERAKQLLKDGGVAGIILPSSILSNSGIYSRTRELILRYFDIVAIAEFGGGTFMATNTNTVVLFLRRRDNYFASNIREAVNRYFATLNDVTINQITTPVARYVDYVWEGLSYSDYTTLLGQDPNEKVREHDIFKRYLGRFTVDSDFWKNVIEIEKEKIFYFILAFSRKVVVVKSGDKEEEKRFLGYKFSTRRGNEGIRPIWGDNIGVCTEMFDLFCYDNPEKASTYIYRAFKGEYDFPIDESMRSHVSRHRLVDMLSFNRDTFEKEITLTVKDRATSSGKWRNVRVGDAVVDVAGDRTKIPEEEIRDTGKYPVVTQNSTCLFSGYADSDAPITDVPLVLFGDHSCAVKYIDRPFLRGADGTVLLKPGPGILPKYFYYVLEDAVKLHFGRIRYERHSKYLRELYIPVASPDVQKSVIEEMDGIENEIVAARNDIEVSGREEEGILSSVYGNEIDLEIAAPFVTGSVRYGDIEAGSYVTTDNMLQNKLGITLFEGVANIESVTGYRTGDVLVSNIRPYLKKIWFADREGGCSKDVLVFRSSDTGRCIPEYLYYMLRRDEFFDYMMEGKKGLKMPRGDKKAIGKYRIPMPPVEEQRRIVGQVEALGERIAAARAVIEGAAERRRAVLAKYL